MDLFSAALSAEPGSVCMSVVKDIPITVNLHNTSMVISAICCSIFSFFVAVDMKITVTYDNTAVGVWSIDAL